MSFRRTNNTRMKNTVSDAARRAYTITELLIVIVIASLLLSVAVPSFTSLIESTRQALAYNTLEQSLRSARDAALNAQGQGDTAAVFLYAPDSGITVLTCQYIGTFDDNGIERDLFAPFGSYEPVQFPPGWSVRGYAPYGFLQTAVLGVTGTDDWFDDTIPDGSSARNAGQWVFPETSFFNKRVFSDGADRQTFMIRFDAETGELSKDSRQALVIAPRATRVYGRNGEDGSPSVRAEQVEQATDTRNWARAMLALPDASRSLPLANLLGDASGDTILAQPVSELALYKEEKLALGVGARRVNRETGTLYADEDDPMYDNALFGGSAPGAAQLASDITAWIEGRASLGTGVAGGDGMASTVSGIERSDAKIFLINPYFGTPTEVLR